MNFYLILKKVQHILLNLMVLAISMSAITAFAQVPADTTFINQPDSSIVLTDTSSTKDSIIVQTQKSDVETTIKYTARDSIRLDVIKNIVYLYGDAKIDYGDITLTAEKIEINWGSNVLTAMGAIDSTGKKTGVPVFKEAEDQYSADTIRYNFKTKKGLISGIVTQQGEGYIHGDKVKKIGEDLYIRDAHYTTCNLEHPHFYIAAPKIKVIPNDKIVSGPFNLYVADIPTPLGFILGLFPVPKKQKSGIIFPMYGESADRGFFLRNGGYYWAVSDYVGIKFIGEIYSRGSYGGQTLT
ncbi:MAG TPA: putative LPS assembly protein LptD, partial [Cytophagaceae bacterium]